MPAWKSLNFRKRTAAWLAQISSLYRFLSFTTALTITNNFFGPAITIFASWTMSFYLNTIAFFLPPLHFKKIVNRKYMLMDYFATTYISWALHNNLDEPSVTTHYILCIICEATLHCIKLKIIMAAEYVRSAHLTPWQDRSVFECVYSYRILVCFYPFFPLSILAMSNLIYETVCWKIITSTNDIISHIYNQSLCQNGSRIPQNSKYP